MIDIILLLSPVYIVIVALAEELLAVCTLLRPPPTHFEISHNGIVAVHVDGGCRGVRICNVAHIASPVDKVIASV